MKNGNEVPTYAPTPEELDQLFARSTEQQFARIDAQKRAHEWPLHVEQILVALSSRLAVLEDRLAAATVRG